MKILSVETDASEIVGTDQDEYPTYRRHSSDNWENLMGESWEQHYHCEEIEEMYQGYRRDGEPCHHPGCLNHVTHACEGCGRVAGRNPERG